LIEARCGGILNEAVDGFRNQGRTDQADMSSRRKQDPAGRKGPVTYETVREIARGLPGTVEGISYGTPAFRVGKSLFVRQHQDGESLVVKINFEDRAMRMRADPETFYITDHYLNYPWILVRLATVDTDDLRDLLEEAWRLSASKRLLSAHDSARKGPGRGPSRKPRDG
jgi:hypothetical protein